MPLGSTARGGLALASTLAWCVACSPLPEEGGRASLATCAASDPEACALCSAADGADALEAACAQAATPAEVAPPVVRTGRVSIRLSGTAHDVPLLGDQAIDPVDVAFRVRLSGQGGRIGIQLLSRIEATGEDPFAPNEVPTIAPTAPDRRGDIAGSMQVPIDFGEFDALADEGNRRTARVRIRCRLTGAADLAAAAGAAGQVESMHAEGVLLAGIGSEIAVDLSGPIQMSLDPFVPEALPPPSPDPDAVRACLAEAATGRCCLDSDVFGEVARRAGLPADATPPVACTPAPSPSVPLGEAGTALDAGPGADPWIDASAPLELLDASL